MGGQPEKLLTLEEAARRLGVPADDVEAMIRSGKLTAFRLGGTLLRVRASDLEKAAGQRTPLAEPRPSGSPSRAGRWVEFFYFNDFYLIAVVAVLILLAVILAFS
ncbi:MAG: helix-turn-helix domain-containing protein [Candidatus Omnitrophica bacterium]|nr:helix-turn-helix domain-containing protein [Candidatus Omnitrophota bacterium]